MGIAESVLTKLRSLPPDKQQEVVDFVDFLHARAGAAIVGVADPTDPPLVARVQRGIAAEVEALEPGEKPPTADAIEASQKHLRGVASQLPAAPDPHVSAVGDGGLAFEWRHGDRRLFVTVAPGGGMRQHQITVGAAGEDVGRPVSAPTVAQTVDAMACLYSLSK